MLQFIRDARITMIYECASGVQALDLVGRKLGQAGGRYVRAFIEIVTTLIDTHSSENAHFEQGVTTPLAATLKAL